MNPVFAVFLTVLLGSSMYLAGRLHARVGYRFGYRYGYRQGYFDGDRACWNRWRREAQTGYPEALGPIRALGPVSPPVTRDGSESFFRTEGVDDELPDPDRSQHDPVPGEFSDPTGTTYASSAALGRHAQDGYTSG